MVSASILTNEEILKIINENNDIERFGPERKTYHYQFSSWSVSRKEGLYYLCPKNEENIKQRFNNFL